MRRQRGLKRIFAVGARWARKSWRGEVEHHAEPSSPSLSVKSFASAIGPSSGGSDSSSAAFDPRRENGSNRRRSIEVGSAAEIAEEVVGENRGAMEKKIVVGIVVAVDVAAERDKTKFDVS